MAKSLRVQDNINKAQQYIELYGPYRWDLQLTFIDYDTTLATFITYFGFIQFIRLISSLFVWFGCIQWPLAFIMSWKNPPAAAQGFV